MGASSMDERVVIIVREFLQDIDSKEPFDTELMNFKLRFRAKLLEIITSFPTEPQLANRGLDYSLESIEKVLREEISRINVESEEILYRTIQTLKVMNEVLKEFMRENRVNDKRRLSSLTGFIGSSVERLRHEYRTRYGGFISSLKRLFGSGRNP